MPLRATTVLTALASLVAVAEEAPPSAPGTPPADIEAVPAAAPADTTTTAVPDSTVPGSTVPVPSLPGPAGPGSSDPAAAGADSARTPPGVDDAVVPADIPAIDARAEFLRLRRLTIPVGGDSERLWTLTPEGAFVVDGRTATRTLTASSWQGDLATFATTTRGYLLATSEGVWEMRLNDGDVRFLPELEPEGVYRFHQDAAFTASRVYRLDRPWERYPYEGFTFDQLNDVLQIADTLLVATTKGLKRLLWDRRAWDDAPIGREAETAHLVRFLPPSTHNQILSPDSSMIATPPLVVGRRELLFEQPGARDWLPVEGLAFRPVSRADADSTYRQIDRLLFQDDAKGREADVWRRWLVMPTGVCRLELPAGGTPFVTMKFPLTGDVRATWEQDETFAWVATTRDLFCVDREFEQVYRFFEENYFVWGFLGEPRRFSQEVTDERGWYCLASDGVIEVFTDSWTWESYGPGGVRVDDVLATAADEDGFWIGTTHGLRWFDALGRAWRPRDLPGPLAEGAVLKLEWQGNDLFAVTDDRVYVSTFRSRQWTEVGRL